MMSGKMNVLAVMFTLLAAVSSESIIYKNCTEPNMFGVSSVEMSPCPSQPCNFKKGTKVNVKFTFTAQEDSGSLEARVYGLIQGIPISYPLPNHDACKDLGVSCPIKKGKTYTYSSSFDVLKSYPAIRVIVEWKLDGDRGNNACFMFPMMISD